MSLLTQTSLPDMCASKRHLWDIGRSFSLPCFAFLASRGKQRAKFWDFGNSKSWWQQLVQWWDSKGMWRLQAHCIDPCEEKKHTDTALKNVFSCLEFCGIDPGEKKHTWNTFWKFQRWHWQREGVVKSIKTCLFMFMFIRRVVEWQKDGRWYTNIEPGE